MHRFFRAGTPRSSAIFTRSVRMMLAIVMVLSPPVYPGEPCCVGPEPGDLRLPTHSILFPGRVVTDREGNICSVIIPLKQAGRLLLLEAIIDGRIGNFILDTGSTGLVLNQTYFRDYMPVDEVDAGGVTGSTGKTYRVRIKRLELSDMIYENLYADVTSLGHIENRRGVKVFGLFGLNLMKHMEMVIDVTHNELQLHRLNPDGNRSQPSSVNKAYDIVGRVDEHRNMMYVDVVIGEKTLEFCLDTGAESNVLDLGLPKKVLSTVTILRRASLHGAGSGKQDVLYGTLNDFTLGGKKMENMHVILTNLSGMSQKYGYTIHGMLGYDFFEKGEIYINLVKHELGIVLSGKRLP